MLVVGAIFVIVESTTRRYTVTEPITIDNDPRMAHIRAEIEYNVRRALENGDPERAESWRRGLKQIEAAWCPPKENGE